MAWDGGSAWDRGGACLTPKGVVAQLDRSAAKPQVKRFCFLIFVRHTLIEIQKVAISR
jgi:hypothetical protein